MSPIIISASMRRLSRVITVVSQLEVSNFAQTPLRQRG
jgi:hypothetical protein